MKKWPLLFLCLITVRLTAADKFVGYDSLRYLNPVFENIQIQKDIKFGVSKSFDGKNELLLLDIYSPVGDNIVNRPAIVWIHGGGFRPGTDKSQGYIVKLATEFAKRGYVCFSINYRVRQNPYADKQGTMEDALDDAMAALNWLRNNAVSLDVDKNKIIIGGGSAGGRISVNLCFKEDSVPEHWDKSGIIGLVDLWGTPDETWKMYNLDKYDPPTIIIHGTEDKQVLFELSAKMDKELEAKGVEHILIPIEGEGHTPIENIEKIIDNVSDFLYDILIHNK